jgi:hypothetical protein
MIRLPNQQSGRAERLKYHFKVQSFRFTTIIVAWVLIGLAFYYRPDLIKQALRAGTRGIEFVGDALPSPWGDRIEIVLREIGGFLWLQITVFIVLVRLFFSTIAALWRLGNRS